MSESTGGLLPAREESKKKPGKFNQAQSQNENSR